MAYAGWMNRHWRVAREVASHPLHRKAPVRSVLRWYQVKLAGRLSGTYPVVPYVGGAVLAAPKAAPSALRQGKFGLAELYEQTFCLHVLRREDLFCDVGANAGVYTVLASKAVGCRSVAFEPVPRTFAVLMQNVWANDIAGRVDARQCGVGREAAMLHFTTELGSMNHVVQQPADRTVEVPVATLDQLLEGRVPRVIKVDVEGFESAVIDGARATLSHPDCAAVIMEVVRALERYGHTREQVIAQMGGFGFEPFWYDPFRRELTPVGECVQFHYNQIFVRDLDLVRERIASAPHFVVHGTRM
jgi:FkbM family methyltransferase